MDKKRLRKKFRVLLEKMGSREIKEKSKKACKNLISTPQFNNAAVIMLFLSLDEEIDTTDAIEAALKMGKTVCVPKIFWQEKNMIAVELKSFDEDFSTEKFGLKTPLNGRPVALNKIELIVTPGLSFDKKGNRLGRGGGYYDKFFSNAGLRAKKCGFAFSEQLARNVPRDNWDMPVDLLVTDDQIIYC